MLDAPPVDWQALADAFRGGDTQAAEVLAGELLPYVTNLVGRLAAWSADADDLVQDVLVAALAARSKFRGDARLETWITRIAINRCRAHARKQWVRRLKKHEPDAKIAGIQLSPNARISDDMQLYSLTVYHDEGGAELDESDLDELWHRARKELEQSLRVLQDASLMDRALAFANRGDDLQIRRAQYLSELQKVLDESEQLGGETDGPIEEVTAQLVDAVKRLRELQLDLVSIEARREAIETRIDELRHQGDAEAGSDPVIAELRKIVEIRNGAIARLHELQIAGVVGGDDSALQDAEMALAQARIELLRAERAVTNQASGALLREFNDELSKLYVEDADVRARIKAIEELAVKLRERTSLTTRRAIDEVRERVEALKARAARADQELAELREQKEIIVNSQSRITIRPLEDVLAPPAEADESDESP